MEFLRLIFGMTRHDMVTIEVTCQSNELLSLTNRPQRCPSVYFQCLELDRRRRRRREVEESEEEEEELIFITRIESRTKYMWFLPKQNFVFTVHIPSQDFATRSILN
jgi:hypothetical protein